jgi:hypothetical protein
MSPYYVLISLFIGVPLTFYIISWLIGRSEQVGIDAENDAYDYRYRKGFRRGEEKIGYERGEQAGEAIGETHAIDDDFDL